MATAYLTKQPVCVTLVSRLNCLGLLPYHVCNESVGVISSAGSAWFYQTDSTISLVRFCQGSVTQKSTVSVALTGTGILLLTFVHSPPQQQTGCALVRLCTHIFVVQCNRVCTSRYKRAFGHVSCTNGCGQLASPTTGSARFEFASRAANPMSHALSDASKNLTLDVYVLRHASYLSGGRWCRSSF